MSSKDLTLGKRVKWRQRWQLYAAQCSVFFRGFIEHPRMVGSIIPSSRFTVRKMLDPVDWGKCEIFVEYGPGIGTFCRPVLDRLRGDGTMVVIDTNPLYIDYLRKSIRDPRFHAVLGSAEHVDAILKSWVWLRPTMFCQACRSQHCPPGPRPPLLRRPIGS